jgi:NTP pyrophosphatase (non-canonical NTP hydrolase)
MQIHEFQEMMKRLYFKRDSERGVNGTFNWLVDEVAELGEELKGTDKEATEKEFADVIAWLASLANIMGIDLEEAAQQIQQQMPEVPRRTVQMHFLAKTLLP